MPTYCEVPYIVADLGENCDGGSTVECFLNSQKMVSFQPHNSFRCVLMLAPEVSSGSSFRISVNSMFSDSFDVSDGGNQFSVKFTGIE